MATLTTKCECGAEYCSAHEFSEYAIIKEKLSIAENALEFYLDDGIYDPAITKLCDGTKITTEYWTKTAEQALAVIRGDKK